MDKEVLKQSLEAVLRDHRETGLTEQVDYKKFYLYSIITHSTAIEGSTLTEGETALLFDDGIVPGGHTKHEIFMNEDLKNAYELSYSLAQAHVPYSLKMLQKLSAAVMKNTGVLRNTMNGSYDQSLGDYRLENVHPSGNSRSYVNFDKVIPMTTDFCTSVNQHRESLRGHMPASVSDIYELSFQAHYDLVTIHPWSDGNGRMSRLVMNQLQEEYGVLPMKVTKENKELYIEALKISREEGSSRRFIDFMFSEHLSNIRQELFGFWRDHNPAYSDELRETVNHAVEYGKTGNGYLWLRDSFNELCEDTLPADMNDNPAIYRQMMAGNIMNRCAPKLGKELSSSFKEELFSLVKQENISHGLNV